MASSLSSMDLPYLELCNDWSSVRVAFAGDSHSCKLDYSLGGRWTFKGGLQRFNQCFAKGGGSVARL